MPALPSDAELMRMIETAMKAEAPETYRSLKASGTLSQILKSRADAARATYEQMFSEAALRASSAKRNLSAPETVNEVTQARSRAAEVAIAQAVEFAETTAEA